MSKKFTLVLILAALSGLSFADKRYDQLTSQVQKAEKRVDQLEKSSKQIQEMMFGLKKRVGALVINGKFQQQELIESKAKLITIEKKQKALRSFLEQQESENKAKTQAIDETIKKRSKFYGVAIVALFLLFGSSYCYLRHCDDTSERIFSDQLKSAIDMIQSTKEKIVKSDTVLADSLFDILNKLKTQEIKTAAIGQIKLAELDHHLPLKLVDEIHRMRKRFASLPEDTKGLIPLQKSLERLESELKDQGYEIIDHTGMLYTENLSVKANFIPSNDLESNEKIISKVIVPQVNRNGVMIRMADIEVSIGS